MSPAHFLLGVLLTLVPVGTLAGKAGNTTPPRQLPVGAGATTVQPAGAVSVSPGMRVQDLVNRHGPGTTFYLKRGIYRSQQIIPKDGDRFIGEAGAVLDGAKPLHFFRQGAIYAAHYTAAWSFETNGVCEPQHPECRVPQHLFLRGVALQAVANLGALRTAEQFFFDRAAGRVYLATDPAGAVAEMSDVPYAFGGSARKVEIRNLVIRNYASADQQGAVGNHGEGKGWLIEHDDIVWNYGYGIVLGSDGSAIDNRIIHNGQLGIGAGGGRNYLVQGNEIAFNVWNGTSCEWECGGAKFSNVTGLRVIGNSVHDNAGDGLWTDEGSTNVLYAKNIIVHNRLAGISHEISGSCDIRDNVIAANGRRTHRWGWNAQIQIQNARSTRVSHNLLLIDPRLGGTGVSVIQQNRGAAHVPHDILVEDNVFEGGHGAVLAGLFADFRPRKLTATQARFDRNVFILDQNDAARGWMIGNRLTNFDGWQAGEQDPAGHWWR